MTNGGLYRDAYEGLRRRNDGRNLPTLVAIARKALVLLFRIARERLLQPTRPQRPDASPSGASWQDAHDAVECPA